MMRQSVLVLGCMAVSGVLAAWPAGAVAATKIMIADRSKTAAADAQEAAGKLEPSPADIAKYGNYAGGSKDNLPLPGDPKSAAKSMRDAVSAQQSQKDDRKIRYRVGKGGGMMGSGPLQGVELPHRVFSNVE